MTQMRRVDPTHDWTLSRYYVRFLRPDGSVAAFSLSRKTDIDQILERAAELGWEIDELSPPQQPHVRQSELVRPCLIVD